LGRKKSAAALQKLALPLNALSALVIVFRLPERAIIGRKALLAG